MFSFNSSPYNSSSQQPPVPGMEPVELPSQSDLSDPLPPGTEEEPQQHGPHLPIHGPQLPPDLPTAHGPHLPNVPTVHGPHLLHGPATAPVHGSQLPPGSIHGTHIPPGVPGPPHDPHLTQQQHHQVPPPPLGYPQPVGSA